MAAANAARRSSGPVIRSLSGSPSPSTRFNRHAPSTSAFASAGVSAFNAPIRPLNKPSSPTRVNLYNNSSNSRNSFTLRSMDRPGSSNRSICFSTRVEKPSSAATTPQKRSCVCSPTNHPGSFRCSLHKSANNSSSNRAHTSPTSLNMTRRSAMKNSLVRIGTVEGDMVNRALAALIRPSSHQQRRRVGEFQTRPSRLSVMSMAS